MAGEFDAQRLVCDESKNYCTLDTESGDKKVSPTKTTVKGEDIEETSISTDRVLDTRKVEVEFTEGVKCVLQTNVEEGGYDWLDCKDSSRTKR